MRGLIARIKARRARARTREERRRALMDRHAWISARLNTVVRECERAVNRIGELHLEAQRYPDRAEALAVQAAGIVRTMRIRQGECERLRDESRRISSDLA